MDRKKLISSTERAKRLLFLREEIIRFTREKLSKKSGIPVSTLQNWEQARNNGLTEKGAERLLDALDTEGVNCSLIWLLHGIGSAPTSPFLEPAVTLPHISSEDEIIHKELSLFRELNPGAIDTMVNDDGMTPYYWPGDYVAGVQLFGKEIRNAIGLPCVIQMGSGNILVRILEEATSTNTYNLVCTNRHSITKPVLENITVKSAAPVIWWRRRKFTRKSTLKTETS